MLNDIWHCSSETMLQLLPAHSSLLQQLLTKHAELELLPETDYDQEVLKDMRKQFGAHFIPYCCVEDFNDDGRGDFAVLLAKQTPQKKDLSLADIHRFQHEVPIAVFNGLSEGRDKAAFVKNTTAPLVCRQPC